MKLIGIHSHIGSQITDMSSFRNLVIRFNEIQEELEAHGVTVENLNFGGGLGIDYYHPNHLSIPAFDNYFAAIHKLLQVRPGQQVHFEPGRSIVAQSLRYYMSRKERRRNSLSLTQVSRN